MTRNVNREQERSVHTSKFQTTKPYGNYFLPNHSIMPKCSQCSKICQSIQGLMHHYSQSPYCNPLENQVTVHDEENSEDDEEEGEDDEEEGEDKELTIQQPMSWDAEDHPVHMDNEEEPQVLANTLAAVDNNNLIQFLLLHMLGHIRAPQYAYGQYVYGA